MGVGEDRHAGVPNRYPQNCVHGLSVDVIDATADRRSKVSGGFNVLLNGRAVLGATVLVLATSAAYAKPPFAQKEGVKCTYCHTTPPQRNYRGNFYHDNGLSFAGFDDAAEAKKAGVEIGPEADSKPKSWTPPAKAEPEKPAEGTKPAGPSVADLKKKADAAAAAAKKAPKDAKAKTAYAAALAALGHAQMLDTTVPPAKRYPTALATLRQAVKLDAKNAAAAADVKAIEDAYRSMGRPIPK
jgi:hypothetical protein